MQRPERSSLCPSLALLAIRINSVTLLHPRFELVAEGEGAKSANQTVFIPDLFVHSVRPVLPNLFFFQSTRAYRLGKQLLVLFLEFLNTFIIVVLATTLMGSFVEGRVLSCSLSLT